MDLETAIELIEDSDGTVAHEILIEAWQYLIDSRMAWNLQGWYGRQADRLIALGVCTFSA
jgi:hypothetical protein